MLNTAAFGEYNVGVSRFQATETEQCRPQKSQCLSCLQKKSRTRRAGCKQARRGSLSEATASPVYANTRRPQQVEDWVRPEPRPGSTDTPQRMQTQPSQDGRLERSRWQQGVGMRRCIPARGDSFLPTQPRPGTLSAQAPGGRGPASRGGIEEQTPPRY